VSRAWKGTRKGEVVEVESGTDGAACGYNFAEHASYIVIASGGGSEPFSTGLCADNRGLREKRARAELDSLNVIAKWSKKHSQP
jgi:hypothetical protein